MMRMFCAFLFSMAIFSSCTTPDISRSYVISGDVLTVTKIRGSQRYAITLKNPSIQVIYYMSTSEFGTTSLSSLLDMYTKESHFGQITVPITIAGIEGRTGKLFQVEVDGKSLQYSQAGSTLSWVYTPQKNDFTLESGLYESGTILLTLGQ